MGGAGDLYRILDFEESLLGWVRGWGDTREQGGQEDGEVPGPVASSVCGAGLEEGAGSSPSASPSDTQRSRCLGGGQPGTEGQRRPPYLSRSGCGGSSHQRAKEGPLIWQSGHREL